MGQGGNGRPALAQRFALHSIARLAPPGVAPAGRVGSVTNRNLLAPAGSALLAGQGKGMARVLPYYPTTLLPYCPTMLHGTAWPGIWQGQGRGRAGAGRRIAAGAMAWIG